MPEKFEFIGRKYSEEEKVGASKALSKWAEKGKEKMEGELEKTEKESKLIMLANILIQEELRSLGIESYKTFSLDRAHVLSSGSFKHNFPDHFNAGHNAFYDSGNNTIFVNREMANNDAQFLFALTHELVHYASEKKFYVGEDKGIYNARSGYSLNSDWKNPDRRKRLGGFNEIMDSYLVYKMFCKGFGFLKEELGIKMEDVNNAISYRRYIPLFEAIIEKIGESENTDFRQAFIDFEKGLFDKNILVLKKIEKAFGKDSLEVLSYLGVLQDGEKRDALDRKIKEFFLEKDNEKRAGLIPGIREFFNEAVAKEQE
jgi:hypothetical protein